MFMTFLKYPFLLFFEVKGREIDKPISSHGGITVGGIQAVYTAESLRAMIRNKNKF